MEPEWRVTFVDPATGDESWSVTPAATRDQAIAAAIRRGDETGYGTGLLLVGAELLCHDDAPPGGEAAADEPPAEWETLVDLEAPEPPESSSPGRTALPAVDSPETHDWNKRLAVEGLRVIDVGGAAIDPVTTSKRGDEVTLTTVVGPPAREPAAKQRAAALTVIDPAGNRQLREVRDDLVAIAAVLDRDGELAAFRRAMGRGRPSPDRAAVRVRLAQRCEELAGAGAYGTAIAEVLGCGRDAVARLAIASQVAS